MELDHRNGSSKRSKPENHTEDGDGTGSPSDAYPKLRVRIGSSNHLGVNAEMKDGSPSSTSSEPHHVTVVDEIGSRDSLKPNLDDGVNEDGVMIPSMHIDSPSSSASSNSSLEDIFQVDTKKGSTPVARFIPSDEPQQLDSPPSFRPQGNGASSGNPFKSEVGQEGILASGALSTECEVLHEPAIPIMSPPTQSPPMQMMERPEGYDPFRIPSSVFQSSPSTTTPLDWSVASNESLFSIHVGNNSFSRDNAFPISGEFAKSDELLMYSPKPQFGMPVHVSPLVPIMEIENNREPFQPEKCTAAIEAPELVVENQKIKEATKAPAVEAQNEQKKPVVIKSSEPSGLSTHSNGSGDSGKSFAFPILPDRTRSGSDNSMPVKENHQANDEVGLEPSSDAPTAQKSGYCGWINCFSPCCSWGFPYHLCRCCC